MKKIITFIILFLCLNINVQAASLCSYTEQTELSGKASNVKATYELVEEEVEFTDGTFAIQKFKVNILNVTKDLYVVVKNNVTEDEITYRYTDNVDGIIGFEWTLLDSVTTFTIQVYSSINTNCPDEKYKTIYLTTPRYNRFSEMEICNSLDDFYLCQKYVTFQDIDKTTFLDKIDSFQKGEISNDGENLPPSDNLSILDKIINFVTDYIVFILGSIVIILVIIYVIHRIKTKKQRELGL